MANLEEEIGALKRIAMFHGSAQKNKRTLVDFYTWCPSRDGDSYYVSHRYEACLSLREAIDYSGEAKIYQGVASSEEITPTISRRVYWLSLLPGERIEVVRVS